MGKGHCSSCGDVERVDIVCYPYADPTIGGREHGIREPRAFSSEKDGESLWCVNRDEVIGVVGRSQSPGGDAEIAKALTRLHSRVHPRPRKVKYLAHRHPNAPPRVRVDAGGVDDHRVRAEGPRGPCDRTQVLWVVQTFENDDSSRSAYDLFD